MGRYESFQLFYPVLLSLTKFELFSHNKHAQTIEYIFKYIPGSFLILGANGDLSTCKLGERKHANNVILAKSTRTHRHDTRCSIDYL
jgi:hypothetical protein